jgi:hypothetical protein
MKLYACISNRVRQAEIATRSEDKAMWLKIAEQWIRLADEAETQGSMW